MTPQRENVGTFDLGIKAAEWSPDEELLAIITGTLLPSPPSPTLADVHLPRTRRRPTPLHDQRFRAPLRRTSPLQRLRSRRPRQRRLGIQVLPIPRLGGQICCSSAFHSRHFHPPRFDRGRRTTKDLVEGRLGLVCCFQLGSLPAECGGRSANSAKGCSSLLSRC